MPDPPTTSRQRGFQQAPPQAFTTLYPHRTPSWRYPVARAGPAIEHQRIQGPVGIRVHLDPAVPSDQYGHLLAAFPALDGNQSGVQEILRLFGELHPVLIANPEVSFSVVG